LSKMRKAFGECVREHRRKKGVRGQDLAKLLDVSQANVSKIENGLIKPSVELATKIGRALKLPAHAIQELEQLARCYLYDFDRWTFEESDQYHMYQNVIAARETAAAHLAEFVWNVVPGLLQTREYIEAMHLPLNLEPQRLEEVVNLRVQRQGVLQDRNKLFRFLMAEQGLYTFFADVEQHIAQLKKVRSVLARPSANITLRILRKDEKLALIPNSNFDIYDFTTVLVTELNRTFTVWYTGQVEAYNALFAELWEKACGKKKAVELVDDALAFFCNRPQ
jgi:transcriptional regulator with XRE-family HTH domain